MRKFDANQTIAVLANVGVILSIVFLAFEISQNNAQLRAQAEFTYMQSRSQERLQMVFDPEFAEYMLTMVGPDSDTHQPTDVDVFRWINLMQVGWLEQEWEYSQMLDGNLPETRESLREKWRADWLARFSAQGWRGEAVDLAWQGLRSSLRPEFVEFWEQEIIGPD